VAIIEDNGIVLRSLRYRDTSRICTLLTERCGKISVIAKGARDIKSPFGAGLDPLTEGQIVFYLKSNRSLHLLRAAWVTRAYLTALAVPLGYHVATAALEFIQKIVPDEDPNPQLYHSLRAFLETIDSDPVNPRATVWFKMFQIHSASILGYTPQLDMCARCEGEFENYAGFGVAAGGLVCRRCAGAEQILPLATGSLRMLRAVLGREDEPDLNQTNRSIESHDRELVAVIGSFLRYHLSGYKGLKALRCLNEWSEMQKNISNRQSSAPR
jgi:DNA repair protein RecO (recombination protein O)